MTDNTNPGNFANRPREEVQNIAKKGGQSSHSGGFASMDPSKQVCCPSCLADTMMIRELTIVA